MSGTLKDIIFKTRQLIGTDISGKLSHSDILTAVNRFYQNDLPRITHVQDMTWWYNLTLEQGRGDYGVFDDIFFAGEPVKLYDSINDKWWNLWVTYDKDLFWANYEFNEDASEEALPAAVLIFSRTLYIRPTPDAAYVLWLPCKGKPQALSDLSDAPARTHWDECIAYGAAQKILMDHNEIEAYPNVQAGLDRQISLLAGEYALQNTNRRAIRSF